MTSSKARLAKEYPDGPVRIRSAASIYRLLDFLRLWYNIYTIMEVEFDPSKSVSNKMKHGIDFIEAQNLWGDPRRVEFETQFVDEKRYGIIAEYSGKLCVRSTLGETKPSG